jgi:hypothetical protein
MFLNEIINLVYPFGNILNLKEIFIAKYKSVKWYETC